MESISSKNTILGAAALARLKTFKHLLILFIYLFIILTFLIAFSESPTHLLNISGPYIDNNNHYYYHYYYYFN